MKRFGPAADGASLTDPEVGGEFPLEGRDFVPENVAAAIQYAAHREVNVIAMREVLRLRIGAANHTRTPTSGT